MELVGFNVSRELKSRVTLFTALLVVTGLLCAGKVHAAPLNYTSSATVSLTSPAINFTIVASSSADTLVVNATSVVVTISSATGGSFSLTSASRDLSIATSSSGGTVTQSCVSGVASTTISQSSGSTSYTIAPTSSACAITISNVNSSVSGNSATITWTTNFSSDSSVSYGTTVSYGSTASGSSGVTSHSVSLSNLNFGTTYHYSASSTAGTTTATSSDATFSIAAQVSAGVGGGAVAPYVPSVNHITTSTTIFTVTSTSMTSLLNQLVKPLLLKILGRDLASGSLGDDVRALQSFLISQSKGPLSRKLATVGANGHFGPITQKALSEYQWSVGIRPANGRFGPKTRAYVNSLKQ